MFLIFQKQFIFYGTDIFVGNVLYSLISAFKYFLGPYLNQPEEILRRNNEVRQFLEQSLN